MQEYRNDNGTYTSPRNGKTYKSEKAFTAHWYFKKTDKFHDISALVEENICCKFCNRKYGKKNLNKHENNCYLNPINKVDCKFCNKPILNYRSSKGTCSRSCSNSYFRTGENNGNYKTDDESNYVVVCFRYHKRKCIVCPEEKIVAVHHYNEDHNDNRPENLIPLCPTHHTYIHSRYKYEITDIVNKYVLEFKNKLGVV